MFELTDREKKIAAGVAAGIAIGLLIGPHVGVAAAGTAATGTGIAVLLFSVIGGLTANQIG